MARGILSVSETVIDGKRRNTLMIDEAFDADHPGETYILNCTSKDPEFLNLGVVKNGRVRQAGEKLYGALAEHQAIERHLFLLTDQPHLSGAPLYIRVNTPNAEEFPWEALWKETREFMVLNAMGRWPIGRLASSPTPAPLHKNIGTRLRLAVVLAAARADGVDPNAAEEWTSISNGFSKLNAPLDVLRLISDENVKAAPIPNLATGCQVATEYVGNSSDSLINRLRAFGPNIIHIFCHGAAGDRPALELETRIDHIAGKAHGSISLKSDDLGALASLDSLWLVVLNCCEGGKSTPHLHSLAKDLVKARVPAVIAMREPIRVEHAHLFALHFYFELFDKLQKVFADRKEHLPPDPVSFEENTWVGAVHKARRELSRDKGRIAEDWPEWTYPVVYVNRDELQLHPKDITPAVAALTADDRLELQTELDVLRETRDKLGGAGAPHTKLDVRIHEIEAKLVGA